MIFTIFRDFSGIFLDLFKYIFEFKSIKTIKNKQKADYLSRGTHVDATWHARPRGRATWTHASACMAQR